MDLEKKHLIENNKACFWIGIIIQVFMLAATFMYIERRWLSTPLMVVIEVISIIVAVFGYVKLKDSENGHYPLLFSLASSYMVMLIGSLHTPYMWAFATLIGVNVIVYNNVKITKLAAFVAVLENVIYMVAYYAGGFYKTNSSRFMVITNMLFVLVFVFIALVVVKTNARQIEETMDDIRSRAAEEAKQAEKVKYTADQVAIKLEAADEAMDSLSEKVHASSEAVRQISSAISQTAEAIQTQTEMNTNISQSLSSISDESKEMADLAAVVKDNVGEGNRIINDLQMQADETAKVNRETSEMTASLANTASTVNEIVSAILAISSQTNLLALNASIEAARAGEAGKGFAVVADEIRNLSEDTKASAERIAATIEELITSVDKASTNMNKSVESSNKQGILIGETGTKFNDILTSVNELIHNVEQIAANVNECAKATTAVTDAISDLSAMSEEVAASSESSLRLSDDCVDDMDETNRLLEEILELSRN